MGAPASASKPQESTVFSISYLASLIPILCAIALYTIYVHPVKPDAVAIISALERAASSTKPELQRVSVGYNSNLDLIVADATDLFRSMALKPAEQNNHASIASTRQLEETISYFFARVRKLWSSESKCCRGVQASASSRKRVCLTRSSLCEYAHTFHSLLQASKALEKKHYFIGGNAALMAQRFAEKGCQVHLGGAIGSTLKSLLHSSIWSGASAKDVVDEVHLILEYKKGSTWGDLQAPRANRFIIVRDLTNSALVPLEEFHSSAVNFNPQLIIISGLHLLEGQPSEKRTVRLQDVVKAMRATPRKTPLHFELASVGGSSFLAELLGAILPEVDSLGLNEQELGSSYVALGGKEYNTSDFVQPTPHIAATALEFLLTSPVGSKRLRRIHFHSLGFHIIAHSAGTSPWTDQKARAAVAAASLATTRQACDAQSINPNEVDVLLSPVYVVASGAVRHTANEGVTEWSQRAVRFFLAPVLVCKTPLKTVGLGDIISATGLLYSY